VNRYLIEACGFEPVTAEALDFTVESGCRFHRSLSYPETVEVGIRTARVGATSVRWEWALFQEDQEEAAADGHFIHVFVDRTTQRPIPIPPRIRSGLERILVADALAESR
jgi:acyl-CoA thioester hydrolase